MTKVEMFKAIEARVSDNEEMVNFIEHEIELTEKRNHRKSKGMTKTQKENIEIKDAIMVDLSDGEFTATEVAKMQNISVAKATALLTQLVKSEAAVRIANGKKITFTAM